jgi:hypothetical protein
MAKERLIDLIREAVSDVARNGFSLTLLKYWTVRLEQAALLFRDTSESERRLAKSLSGLFDRKTSGNALKKAHLSVSKTTLQVIAPRLRPLLTERIMASADLIRMNRNQSIDRTLERFAGWMSSVPVTGTSQNTKEVFTHIAKPLRSMSFEERRLFIDQGHKLIANVNYVIALQTDAIAGMWRHVHQAGYDGRPEHEARDGKWYVFRESWAHQDGFIGEGEGFIEDLDELPAMPVNCRCWFQFAQNLRDLPVSLLTAKGRTELESARTA